MIPPPGLCIPESTGPGPGSEDDVNDQEKKIAREMLPYLIHIVWPVLIIVFIAKTYAPSTF